MFIFFFSVDIIPANICFLRRRRGKRWRRELWSLTVKNIIWKEGSHGHDGHASPFLISYSPSLTPLWRYIQTVFDNDRPLYLFPPSEQKNKKEKHVFTCPSSILWWEERGVDAKLPPGPMTIVSPESKTWWVAWTRTSGRRTTVYCAPPSPPPPPRPPPRPEESYEKCTLPYK